MGLFDLWLQKVFRLPRKVVNMAGDKVPFMESSQTGTQGGSRCTHCGGTNIESGLQMNQFVEIGPFGLVFKRAGIFQTTEPLRADLCRGCGSVTRLWVSEPNRNWSK